jgi:hypothetical protein
VQAIPAGEQPLHTLKILLARGIEELLIRRQDDDERERHDTAQQKATRQPRGRLSSIGNRAPATVLSAPTTANGACMRVAR